MVGAIRRDQHQGEFARMFRPIALCSAVLCLATLVTIWPGPGSTAAPQSFRGEYTVSFLGLPIARAAFQSRYDGAAYRIDGSVASAGLAQIFDDTKGTIVASGRLAEDGLQPRSFRADYTSGRKASLVDIRFANGTVTSTKVVPAPKKRGKDWIALDAADLKSALDPIAATVVRAPGLDQVCGRTVKMYDGELRADLKLSFVKKDKISVEGYEGQTVTCRMGFEPVSGYRQGKRALDYLKNRSRIMVTFAPLGQTGVYAPIHATVGTEIGTITVRARRFETTN
jgi:hypothetical protein